MHDVGLNLRSLDILFKNDKFEFDSHVRIMLPGVIVRVISGAALSRECG